MEAVFRKIVEKIFNNWQNLRLAVEHGMGGRNGQQVAMQVMDYTYQYCICNENITPAELEDVIREMMDQEFNTLCEDDSIQEMSSNLVRYKQMCVNGKEADIEAELSKLPKGKDWLRPDVKITYTPIDIDSSSCEEDGDDDETDSDMEMLDAAEEKPTCMTSSQSHKRDGDFVEPEDGWTTVRTRRK